MRKSLLLAAAFLVISSIGQAQQPQTAQPTGPAIGDSAPDFTLHGATRFGILSEQIKLSSYRGQTVVLAFFPRARTGGCTKQMCTYRDQYTALFSGGKDVVVIAISTDADTTLASWAREEGYPILFGSDPDGVAGKPYGTYQTRGTSAMEQRYLYVIAPDGKIAYVAKPFKVSDQASYDELSAAIKKLKPATPQ